MQDPLPETPSRLVSGTPAFRRLNLALFAAGFSTFAILYCVQPLLPEFSQEFHVSAAVSSLSLSLSTGLLAVAMLVAGSLSEVWGRKPVMVASLFASAFLTLLSAAAPNWTSLLLARMAIGITLSGLPAVAMAYVSEEVDPKSIGLAMGLFIGGNAVGGMAGRIISGVLTDLGSWRVAIGLIGAVGLASALAAWRSLPASAHFHPRPARPRQLLRSFGEHLRDPGLRALFAEAFLLMGGFVTIYNYLGYRLTEPPYSLSQSAIGAIFSAYLIGTLSSAWIGELAGRLGRRRVLWAMIAIMIAGVMLTLFHHLALILAGIVAVTFGFFGAHSIASSWVGNRALGAKAQASALYLFCYYLGSSAIGTLGGVFWTHGGWPGVAALVTVLLIAALVLSLRLMVLAPRESKLPPGQ
ncbi:MFS transporter [Microvirga lotononidis]|uniref:Arabinose efflux permease family protein n=1 Tax=Microvirga lotononidis TaxID=864069 RepID=I4YSN7_9HYPH|nr:MFS transporter [Microvirga lotononidis]EIM26979.1 arabinose efflux permease family protein [Microvirga lotononidis]WQO28829.1 MFS transporter [Microvirga lotononidis]